MDNNKFIELKNYSNPEEVIRKAYLYFGEHSNIIVPMTAHRSL